MPESKISCIAVAFSLRCWEFTVHGRFDTRRFGTNRSRFVAHVKLIRYKLTLFQVVPRQNTTLERTQTSVVNKTNTYLHDPPHVPKPPTQWEHANETKFWLSVFIENRYLYKYIWDFFYNPSAYYTYDQETQILSIMSCKSVMQRTREETGVILARG